jgi:hypothetical protein
MRRMQLRTILMTYTIAANLCNCKRIAWVAVSLRTQLALAARRGRRAPSTPPPGRYAGELLGASSFWPSLRAALKEDAIDVLHLQEYWPGRFDLLVCRVSQPLAAVDEGGSMGRHLALARVEA